MQKIAILYDASQAVLSTFELDEVLQQILTIVRDYFHLEGGSILLLDRKRKTLKVRLSFGAQPNDVEVQLGQGLTGTAAKSKRPIYSPDVLKDPRYLNIVDSTRSEVAIPLMVRDEVVGVLDCQSKEPNFFDTETVDLLTLFATQASIALVNAEIYSKERKRAGQMEAISAIARQATALLKVEELLHQFCLSIGRSLPQHSVAVLTTEEDGTLLLRAHGGSLPTSIAAPQTLLPVGNAAEKALQDHVTLRIARNLENEPLLHKTAGAELFLPLVSAGQRHGMLVFADANADAFPEEDLPTFESLADICATALENATLYQRAEQLANHDGLTGVFNRRFFERRIGEEIERARRYDGTLSLMMLDIDHFKLINDEFGHLLGDEVLRTVSHLLQQALRKPDICCRYGGEEFAIVLPETTGHHATLVAEKLRHMVSNFRFPGIPRAVTISIGVSDYPRCGETRDHLVRAADASLYVAKQAGRNRVISPDSANISPALS